MKTGRLNKLGRIYLNSLLIFLHLLFSFPLLIKFNVFYLIIFAVLSIFLLEFYWNSRYSEFEITDQYFLFRTKSIFGRKKKTNRKISWDKIEKIITLESDWTGYGSNIIVDRKIWSCIIHGLTENYQDLLKEICARSPNAIIDEQTRIVIEKGIQLWGQKKYFFPKTLRGKIIGSVSLVLLLYAIIILFNHYSVFFLNHLSTQAYLSIEFILMVIVGVLFIPLWRK